jgi:hypothetical protein
VSQGRQPVEPAASGSSSCSASLRRPTRAESQGAGGNRPDNMPPCATSAAAHRYAAPSAACPAAVYLSSAAAKWSGQLLIRWKQTTTAPMQSSA